MFVSAIVVAAGRGRRFRGEISKPFLKIKAHPVIIYPLIVLSRHSDIKEIIVVGNPDNIDDLRSIIKKYKVKKVSKVILGGRERQDSVLKGLKETSKDADLVLIHDGVRPFISRGLVNALIKEAHIRKAAILGVPVKATIKLSDKKNYVRKTLDRDYLYEIQTPQVYERKLLLKAYEMYGNKRVTDDAALIEKMGLKVKIVLGDYSNIKITTIEDFLIAKEIAKTWKTA